MRAIVIEAFGGPEQLKLADVPTPSLGPNQVRLEVHATALNRADLLQRRGLYPPPPGESELLGLECAGVVEALGPGVTRCRIGDRVMALLPGGGYAEQAVIHEEMAIPIPEALSFEAAAAIPEAFLTAYEGLFSLGQLKAGDSVLIHAAAGGVGSAAVQLAKRAGAQVIACVGSDEKIPRVKQLGADHVINYKTQDFAARIPELLQASASAGASRGGVQVVMDFVGGSYWEKHAKVLAVGGRCVVIGILGGAKAEVNLGLLLMKRHQILGLVMRSRPLQEKIELTQRFIQHTLSDFSTGNLVPVIDKIFPIENAGAAHEYLESNAAQGKVILKLR